MPCFSMLSSGFTPDMNDKMAGILVSFYLVYFVILLAMSLVSYLFSSLGYSAIAKRRGIGKAWLAWIPVGQLWILGSISNQYQLQTHFRTKSKRKILLWLQIIMIILAVLMLVFAAVTVLSVLDVAEMGEYPVFIDVFRPVRENLMDMVLLYFLMFGIAIAITVVQYFALYDLYRSCNPDSSVLFLVLSILIPISMPFLIFSGRKKDLGMQSPGFEDPHIG